MWRLTKQNTGKEHNMVTVDGIDYWWCEEHMWDGDKRPMYVTHRPGPEHEEWQKRKDARKAKMADRRAKRARTPATEPSPTISANATSASAEAAGALKGNEPKEKKWKLAMNSQLQSALVTNTNLTPQQFQAFWTECDAEANEVTGN